MPFDGQPRWCSPTRAELHSYLLRLRSDARGGPGCLDSLAGSDKLFPGSEYAASLIFAAWGEVYQFDWSHETAVTGGDTTTVKVAQPHCKLTFPLCRVGR